MDLPPELLYMIYTWCDLKTKHNFYHSCHYLRSLLLSRDRELHEILEYHHKIEAINEDFRRELVDECTPHLVCSKITDKIYQPLLKCLQQKHFGYLHCPCGTRYLLLHDLLRSQTHVDSERHQDYFNNFFRQFEERESWEFYQQLRDVLADPHILGLYRLHIRTSNDNIKPMRQLIDYLPQRGIYGIFESLKYWRYEMVHLIDRPNLSKSRMQIFNQPFN